MTGMATGERAAGAAALLSWRAFAVLAALFLAALFLVSPGRAQTESDPRVYTPPVGEPDTTAIQPAPPPDTSAVQAAPQDPALPAAPTDSSVLRTAPPVE